MNKRRKVVEYSDPAHPDVNTAAESVQVVNSTKFGKDLRIERLPTGFGYYITIAGSRLVGKILEGTFTSYRNAEQAIQQYVDTNKSKV